MMSFSLFYLVVLLFGAVEGMAKGARLANDCHRGCRRALGYTCKCYGLNVALRGKATQSELIGPPHRGLGHASNAIDGNRNSNAHHGSCTHTALNFEPWWRVDLLTKYKVHSVVITNRGDCCPERLAGAQLRIGSTLYNEGNSNPVCAVLHIPAGQSKVFYCHGMEGRWVNVVIPGRSEYLTLCEVEVYGEPSYDNDLVD